MKKTIKKIIITLLLAVSTSAFAKEFDWSKCWCNYGGGLENGDFLLNIGTGIHSDPLRYNDGWFWPSLEVSGEYVHKIWVLPFSFGANIGWARYGYSNHNFDLTNNMFYTGANVKYHIQFPPEKLDLYVVHKFGFMRESWEEEYADRTEDHTKLSLYSHFALGASYYFSESIGFNLELGYPLVIKGGVSIKL